jgi:UDP-N-acetylglucosamine--N-acetylmuramyl-(pentapeptide) pyrophosphoryl-undecaprenol N-acetylglucosamine transferase
MNLLILGGSQGAAIFSTLLPKTLALLSEDERSKITMTLQCRAELLDTTHKALDTLGIKATLAPFFETMQDLYEQADFIIARSGASTVSEVTVAGRAALFVPYPHAMDNHQYHNAKAMHEKVRNKMPMHEACYLIEQKNLTPEKLSDLLRDCLESPDMLKSKAQAIQHYSMADAASHLAHVIEDLLPPTLSVTHE